MAGVVACDAICSRFAGQHDFIFAGFPHRFLVAACNIFGSCFQWAMVSKCSGFPGFRLVRRRCLALFFFQGSRLLANTFSWSAGVNPTGIRTSMTIAQCRCRDGQGTNSGLTCTLDRRYSGGRSGLACGQGVPDGRSERVLALKNSWHFGVRRCATHMNSFQSGCDARGGGSVCRCRLG